MVLRLVAAAGGRKLAVETTGDPHGKPVFLLHGMPGSRMGPVPRSSVLSMLGIRLISFDRPGYGGSDRRHGRRVADAAEDVLSVADAFGLDSFAALGRSGGAPHALACAALIPDRMVRAATLVSLAPRHAEGLDWYGGMTRSNAEAYTDVERGEAYFSDAFHARAVLIRDNPHELIANLVPELPPADRAMVSDPGIRRMLVATYQEAFRNGADGWIDDLLAFTAPWGFEVEDIRVPVRLWHGADDKFSPVDHSRWLADRIPGAELYLEPGAAHFGAFKVMTEALKWAAG